MEKVEQQQQNDPKEPQLEVALNAAAVAAVQAAGKEGVAAGRQPRQSHEDSNRILNQLDQEQAAVLQPPRNNDGPGEMGKGYKLGNLTEEQQRLVKQGFEKNAFNQYISDLISLHRSLPDVRPKGWVNWVLE